MLDVTSTEKPWIPSGAAGWFLGSPQALQSQAAPTPPHHHVPQAPLPPAHSLRPPCVLGRPEWKTQATPPPPPALPGPVHAASSLSPVNHPPLHVSPMASAPLGLLQQPPGDPATARWGPGHARTPKGTHGSPSVQDKAASLKPAGKQPGSAPVHLPVSAPPCPTALLPHGLSSFWASLMVAFKPGLLGALPRCPLTTAKLRLPICLRVIFRKV